MLLVISAFGGVVKKILKELENMFEKDDLWKKFVAETQKSITGKVLSGLVQSDWISSW